MKKIISAILAAVMLLAIVSCDTKPQDQTSTESDAGKETDPVTDAETEDPGTYEEPVFYEKIERDPIDPEKADLSSTDWNATITAANAHANGVQGKFIDVQRKKFQIFNETSSIICDLSTYGKRQLYGLYNANGAAYLEDTENAYVTDKNGTVFSAAHSPADARMNSNRIGYYYYDFHFRDQIFVNPAADSDGEVYDIIKKTGKWSGSGDVGNLTKKKGTISYDVTSPNDPFIYSAVSFSADSYNALQMTIKADYSSVGYIYLMAGSHKEFSQDQMIKFNFIAGQTSEVYISLVTVPDYEGKVYGLRIDCGSQTGEHIEITDLKAISRGNDTAPLAFERTYHTYPDKIHEEFRIIAMEDYDNGSKFETVTEIPEEKVKKVIIKNKNGEVSSLDGFDFSTFEYVGFDIKDAGIYGIIMPVTENNGYISIDKKDGKYVITRGINIDGAMSKGSELIFGHRLFTSNGHEFNELRKEAYIERNPLTEIYVKDIDDAKFEGYDGIRGCYVLTVQAMEFDTAFKWARDKQFNVNTLIRGDGVVDRTIYIQTAENAQTRRGRLECAAILDENNSLLPIPLEVGKNFDGENEEPLYYPEPGTGEAAYGEVYLPMTIGKDECKQFTVLHLYQNWGNYPLKQLSFIAFHIPYYHLSVGVTETNCIVPYYVLGKDGWTLPDFRSNSAPFWDYGRGTQHTSVGRLYFLQYKDSDGNAYKTESQSARIDSHGPVYADVTMDYLSDDGKIKATYRHVEMAQTDENRTHYKIRLEVLDDVNINDFKNDFSFFTFDSFSLLFKREGYLNENGESVIENIAPTDRFDKIVKLGKEYPYYDYFRGNQKESVNFALIVKSSDITIGGQKFDGNFVFRDRFDGALHIGSLSLDLDAVTLKKGDVLDLELILMPWGYSTNLDDTNVLKVRQDSCIDPYKITVIEGEPYEDSIIPSVVAKNNTATFKISGGRSTAAVKIYGFTGYSLPEVKIKADGNDTDIQLAGPNGYDGYQVNLDKDGTYSISFNVDMDAANEYEITVKQ
ncbi:MAG: hypothetical protein IJT49_04825 [Clostridia bacterium]|nr:hypothetical protein [Clostridia bacterium]